MLNKNNVYNNFLKILKIVIKFKHNKYFIFKEIRKMWKTHLIFNENSKKKKNKNKNCTLQ